MLKGLKINFTEEGAEIDFENEATEHELQMNAAIVFLANEKESNAVYPTNGADLLQKGVTNEIYNNFSAQQTGVIVAQECLDFKNTYGDTHSDKLLRLTLLPTFKSINFLTLDSKFEFSSGATYSSITDLQY